MSRTACGLLRKVTKLSQNKAGIGSTKSNSPNDPLFVRRPAEDIQMSIADGHSLCVDEAG